MNAKDKAEMISLIKSMLDTKSKIDVPVKAKVGKAEPITELGYLANKKIDKTVKQVATKPSSVNVRLLVDAWLVDKNKIMVSPYVARIQGLTNPSTNSFKLDWDNSGVKGADAGFRFKDYVLDDGVYFTGQADEGRFSQVYILVRNDKIFRLTKQDAVKYAALLDEGVPHMTAAAKLDAK